ncbi:uroporphyrinogen-III C-methyltransferase [Tropicibacter naphthalenivorans]|uniref:uroporphyrinogen-III C-methyltransferase n=1 Tax=Tropicibacter naphthalenivorans TaxID=441103 RepID=A0A0P1GF80_9RHOB|nr:uroporphyrinogen-III C-methyltransferase [Tropicibacter naphthalenivorans]CUH80396.1 Siroheme synthase [Tropicibacter naphthalenivorans]SMC86128.1 uroporphyrin-III C-methyltransferase [Tropicibacter naphthalenivorans]
MSQTFSQRLLRKLASVVCPARPAATVQFVGAGPGDADLLTLKALRALDAAEVVIHDRLVGADILALVPDTAQLINVGKAGFGPSAAQEDINALIVQHALTGARVVRLKGGDPTVFGRLDEELDAITAAGLTYEVVPGITAASAALAGIGQSLTKRGRNKAARVMTGHDMQGFADHDWRNLAQPGEVAAIYMGKKAARFVQGRLLMHGAAPDTAVTVIENASRADQRVIGTTLADLPNDLTQAALSGPALLLFGLAPRDAEAHTIAQQEVS